MNATTTDVTTITPPSHREAMELQASQLRRTIALLHGLDDHDWKARTDCPDWDVPPCTSTCSEPARPVPRCGKTSISSTVLGPIDAGPAARLKPLSLLSK